jgi:peptidoglycan/xylan/chitin deacetylase (PgdA/CDA1 family)
MPSKKELLARAASLSGVTGMLAMLPQRPSLLVLNYHRVGDKHHTPYDSGLFSCTTAAFDWQVRWLKRRFPILTLDAALEIVHGRAVPERTSILLTFDDGYRDNFVEAFPVLARHNASATFFLPTAFVGTGRLPWWDEAAWMIKRSTSPSIELTYPQPATFRLDVPDRAPVIMDVLNLFKRAAVADTTRFLDELSSACASPRPGDEAERCFLDWDEARAMQRGGMYFGSHTHNHEILSRLPYQQQLAELSTSRSLLESELDREIDTLAYPHGKTHSFSPDTFQALRDTGYHTAFSFYSGINTMGRIQPFDVLRAGVDGESKALFRLRSNLYAARGSSLV